MLGLVKSTMEAWCQVGTGRCWQPTEWLISCPQCQHLRWSLWRAWRGSCWQSTKMNDWLPVSQMLVLTLGPVKNTVRCLASDHKRYLLAVYKMTDTQCPKCGYLRWGLCRVWYHSSGAVWEWMWTSWAVRPNEPSGFRGRKDLLHRASALVTTCP